MKKIKICFVSTAAYPLFNYRIKSFHGGAELQLYIIANELSKNGQFDVSFIVGNYGQKDIENFHGVQVYKSVNPHINDSVRIKVKNMLAYLSLFYTINPDVIYTSGVSNSIWITSLFCKLTKVHHINRSATKFSMMVKKIEGSGFLGKLMKWGLVNCDAVLVQNKEQQKLFKKYFKKNAILVKNLLCMNQTRPKKQNHILWVGRAVSLKRPELFIDLARHFVSYPFIMICPPVDDFTYLEKIREKASRLNNVELIEGISFKEIQHYFNEAKILVNTSDYEGFPNVFVQAGLGRTPVLSLNVDPDSFLDRYNCGCCCNNDFNKMVKALNVMLTDKKDWKIKSDNIYNYMKQNHSLENNLSVIKDVILKLVDKK